MLIDLLVKMVENCLLLPLAVTLLEPSSCSVFMLCYILLRRIEFEIPAIVERENTISELAMTVN